MTDFVNTNTSTRDVVILELRLVGSNGKVADLLSSFNAINIYEDIFQNVITGTIQLNDGINLLSEYAIHGNEYIYITFGRPGEIYQSQRYTKVFRIFKIADREKSATGQIQNYVIHFCSEELIFSNQQSISRSYDGGNTSEYVGNICLFDLKCQFNKLVDFENSAGQTQFVLTRKKPLQAIEYFAKHSFSAALSPFVFFENKNGFNFVSLQSLYKRTPIATIQFNSAKFTEERNRSPFFNSSDINDFRFNQNFDVEKATREGLYSSKLYTLDLITQTYKENNLSLLNELNSDVMIDGFFPFNDATNRNNKALYEEFNSSVRYWLTNKGRSNKPYFINKRVRDNDTFIEENLAQRIMQIELINNTELHCVVPGNPQYTAGFTVELDIPAFTPNLEIEQVKDPFYSGKYLITAVRHIIVPGSLQTILELSKNSISTSLGLSGGKEYKKAQKL